MSWKIDPAHTSVSFTVRHMMISKVRGAFASLDGNVEFDQQNPSQSALDIEINAASISTGEEQRDGHLRSPDFLDVENYPTLRFRSTGVKQFNEFAGQVTGDLTIRGITKEVSLDVEFAGVAKSPWGTESAGFSASTSINRKDWGLSWNQALETGGILVGDKIDIEIEAEIVKQAETA